MIKLKIGKIIKVRKSVENFGIRNTIGKIIAQKFSGNLGGKLE